LIQEAANAIAARQSVKELAFQVHAHPTLSEVLDEAYKRATSQSM
jgi:dihydrolipoamide dehydrogenase